MNRLADEKSPYLLQHADNPVDWYPWSDEAFEKAHAENKPVFLSIGYSTCHWCHVMAHESFEDPEVARLMNENFISIKVDREERPDIDSIYMTVCQIMTGSGGWPLNLVLTPEKEPFYAATYLPKEGRGGQLGMLQLVPRFGQIWRERKEAVRSSAQKISSALQQELLGAPGAEPDENVIHKAYEQLSAAYDEPHGGFGGAPKFPSAHHLLFLLRYWKRSGENHAMRMVEGTLRGMRQGGIFDQIGGGFHRYSTDSHWLVPHFEKMLYDQATLLMAYTEAYQATGDRHHARVAGEIVDYVTREMTSPEGGFYSAQDADTEGQEGKYYLWQNDDIFMLLDGQDAFSVIKLFNMHQSGNFRDEATGVASGKNILHLDRPLEEAVEELPGEALTLEHYEELRRRLLEHREQGRARPHIDDKILTDWNGLMIAGMSKAAAAFSNDKYLTAAARSADFILDRLLDHQARLLHRYRDGEAAIAAGLDDYAFFIWGLIELYEASFEPKYLRAAIGLCEDMTVHFWDADKGGFFQTADDAETVITRTKQIWDGAVPSGNSVAALDLLRLGHITGRTDWIEMASRIGEVFSAAIAQDPAAYTHYLTALDFRLGPSFDVTIAGLWRSEDTQAMLRSLDQRFIPNRVTLFRPAEEEEPEITNISEATREQVSEGGRATAYVCRNYACLDPVAEIHELLKLLEAA